MTAQGGFTSPRATLSVVVTTFDLARSPALLGALESLAAQRDRDFETVFIGERDRALCDLVAEHGQRLGLSPVVRFNDGAPGLSHARNMGASAASGALIAFLDDDAVAVPGWTEAIRRTFEDASVGAVTGPATPLWDEEPADWLPEEFYWVISCTAFAEFDRPADVRNVWGMNMAFRRRAFEAVDGFSSDVGGVQGKRLHAEEVELSLRIRHEAGMRVRYEPSMAVGHRVAPWRLESKAVRKSAYWIGYTRPLLVATERRLGGSGGTLAMEQGLLGRVLTRVPVRLAKRALHDPAGAWRGARLSTEALASVGYGYLRGTLDTRRASHEGRIEHGRRGAA